MQKKFGVSALKKVLITGGNGFVGKAITELFQCFGCDVFIASRASGCDIADEKSVEEFGEKIKDCGTIIHCAADLSQKTSIFDVNVKGSWNIFSLATKLKCKNIIYISSVPVIGVPKTLPIAENHAVLPMNIYHLSKYFAESLLELPIFKSINCCTLRISSPIGTGMPSNRIFSVFVNNCIKNENIEICGKGGRVQNYIDVRDIAKAVWAVDKHFEEKNGGRELFLIGNTSISNLDLAKKCIEITNSKSQILFDGIDVDENVRWVLSCEKAKKILGFVPEISLKKSILDFFEQGKKCD